MGVTPPVEERRPAHPVAARRTCLLRTQLVAGARSSVLPSSGGVSRRVRSSVPCALGRWRAEHGVRQGRARAGRAAIWSPRWRNTTGSAAPLLGYVSGVAFSAPSPGIFAGQSYGNPQVKQDTGKLSWLSPPALYRWTTGYRDGVRGVTKMQKGCAEGSAKTMRGSAVSADRSVRTAAPRRTARARCCSSAAVESTVRSRWSICGGEPVGH